VQSLVRHRCTTAVDEIASPRRTTCRQMCGECQKSTWQFSGNDFVD
jgi:hypothetical protein